jgi:alkaline phosphatase D
MADQNNAEASYMQYGSEFGGELVSFYQRKMNAVRAYFEWMLNLADVFNRYLI